MNSVDHGWLGKLNWDSIVFSSFLHNPSVSEAVASAAGSIVIFATLATLGLMTWYRVWGTLWSEWLTSTDHKKIGIMYIVFALVMLARGLLEGMVMRAQQAAAPDGFLYADHFAQLFSTHGTIMVFFVAVPFLVGIINYVMPLQIGARDVAFPVLNQLSLAVTVSSGLLMMVSLVVGEFSTGGWSAYPPYTGADFSPGVGPDYWIWAIVFSGAGTTLTGINFTVTILKCRCPGMRPFRMPMFCWTALCSSILMIFALPPLSVAALMLGLDRYLDFHFFTNDLGGNMMNYANLFWLFGHPEVYLLVLPAYGVFSEVFSTFSAKRLYGYKSLVFATASIAVLSFTVWLHHFFTMGQSPTINIVFGIATMLIAVPTGVKVYDWMATMYRGRIRFTAPMIYAIGFLILFVIGGLTGVILANPTVDFQVHNTLFLVAHFHNVLIPGVLFGLLAGYNYWFPKAFGFRLNDKLGRLSAFLWIAGFMMTFFPLYGAGLLGMPRRSFSYMDLTFKPFMVVAFIGAMVILAALITIVVQLIVSVRNRNQNRVPVGDPWDGRSLEWSIPAPAPSYNFAQLPRVTERDAFTEAKEQGYAYQPPKVYRDIELPKNNPLGFILCVASGVLMFALVWYIWWLALVSALVILSAVIASSFRWESERVILASELQSDTERWLGLVKRSQAVDRDLENTPQNTGYAKLEH
ncbi:cbb3-type cytochrome c oxidase subunit I [Microbulbifer spongiae]|uniref:Cbb3-type cytochrome c oxidase subunit I n=1 Tax=Microbulbifer spongiae TaxID=2944933 RepID=A0ABY9EFX6_9GAMM|nr:cbb3-type cytochrome c oxidase subunit I [Microbulbifer sp. MI-G]WKD50941.1 cbb3-type cytochrome c oxidase subunit I [Microbulbifer sp. MI-G]